MKAVRLYGVDDLRVVEMPTPEIGSGEVLLRTRAALICGTDVRMLKNGAKSSPLTLGHELAGVIEAVGRDVRTYRPGQRVAVAPNYGCGVCDPEEVFEQLMHRARLTKVAAHKQGIIKAVGLE